MNLGKILFYRLVRGYKTIKTRETYQQMATMASLAQAIAVTEAAAAPTAAPVSVQPTPVQIQAPIQPPTTLPAVQIQPTQIQPTALQQTIQQLQQLPAAQQFIAQQFLQPQQIPQQISPQIQPSLPQIVRERIPGEIRGKFELVSPKMEVEIEGLEIPEFLEKKVKIGMKKIEEVPLRRLVYPLIPSKPVKGEPIFAYANIYWDSKLNKHIYQVVEPELTKKIKEMLEKIKELLEEKLDVDFSKLKISEAADYLYKQIDQLIGYFGFKISEEERKILKYFIERDFIGLGRIEPFMHDSQIEDISCDGVGIPIFIFHRNPELGSIITNIPFDNAEELDSFITKLSQLTGKSISITQPLLDGTLPDGSRLQATLATDIARKGSNFTIRKFTAEPLTPIHLLNYGSVDVKSLAYLWLAVDYGRSVLVSGGTASGKTSFLNVLSLFIRPDKKIISIEDTAELRLPHPHWVPTVARTAISVEGRAGEIDMFVLLKESLRQRPDYIVVGEVRGQEAYILFQQMATGHPSLATIHSENIDKLVDRLTTPPISLPKTLVGSLDLVVFMLRLRFRDKFVRRVSEILEMISFDQMASKPLVNRIFKWNPLNDKIEVVNKSILLKKISEATGLKEKEILDELERRMLVLNWMAERNITDYKDVYKILNMYYYYPNRVLAAIMGEV